MQSNRPHNLEQWCNNGNIFFDISGDMLPAYYYDIEQFNESNRFYSIIDPFNKKTPQIYSKEYFDSGTLNICLVPTIILDSNVVSYLHQFITNTDEVNTRKNTINLLNFLVKQNIDYNYSFYVLESLCKLKGADTTPIIDCVESILYLHTMDEPYFLKTGQVKANHNLIKIYCDKHEAENLRAIAKNQITFINQPDIIKHINFQTKIVYLLLLKVSILSIQRPKLGDALTNLEKFYLFMDKKLDCIFSRELIIASHIFIDELKRFVPAQKNTSFNKIQEKLISASWDIQLLRNHEQMLTMSYPYETALGYIVTADQGLTLLKDMFIIQSISIYNNELSCPFPKHQVNFSDTQGKKRELLQKMDAFIAEKQLTRDHLRATKLYGKMSNQEEYNNFDCLVNELESELSNLLRQ